MGGGHGGERVRGGDASEVLAAGAACGNIDQTLIYNDIYLLEFIDTNTNTNTNTDTNANTNTYAHTNTNTVLILILIVY